MQPGAAVRSHDVATGLTSSEPRSKFPTNKVKISSAKLRLAGWQPSARWGAPDEDLVVAGVEPPHDNDANPGTAGTRGRTMDAFGAPRAMSRGDDAVLTRSC